MSDSNIPRRAGYCYTVITKTKGPSMRTDHSAFRAVCSAVVVVYGIISHGDDTQEFSKDYPLPLQVVANIGFADDVAGDGKGDWSDQGPENDLRGFDTSQSAYGGIIFSIINPASNSGRAVLTFQSSHTNVSLDHARVAVLDKPSAPHLYLLHTSCWNNLPLWNGSRLHRTHHQRNEFRDGALQRPSDALQSR